MKDPEIRKLFKDTELNHFFYDGDSRVIDELDLAATKARIDIAVVNGSLHGFEIKGASDTLKRLPSQIEAYTKIFDYLSIVTESRYLDKIKASIPKWIGLYVCVCKGENYQIKKIRSPKFNKYKEGFYIAKLLYRNEIIDCLAEYQIPYRKKDRNWTLCEILANQVPLDQLSVSVRKKLKIRNNLQIAL
ncbi:sce7726 family protein [Sphingobacterium bambusae]|uniref:Sce7726 family protein n=1 Tax=Sphingobacterium bambusae TaxID=662858 RepID=A0ABW6BKL9_9SPHI|nr:sce7726 family protein [Sphingobacterium bambusae]WPL49687.1 sce7726 family protein [Sphingobacterium bambusae]